MYFIELLVKYLKKDRFMEVLKEHDQKKALNPLDEIPQVENEENCDHIFMPIDSTNEILACSKCGLVVNRKDLRYKNFFTKKEL